MAKHPVPKKKASKAQSKRTYGAHKTKALKNLTNRIHLVACDNCGEKKIVHTVCPSCGKYRGKQVLNKQKKIDKITKVKA